jgi:signal transduction histidine kinase
MSELIRDVLDFSQLTLNRSGIEPVNLNQVINDVIAEYQPIIESSGAQISFHALPVIQAVPLQMKQLFSNLISNSLKFSRKGMKPVITIKSQRLKKNRLHGYKGLLPDVDYHSITVEDNGIGFNKIHAERIFGIFQRLHTNQEFEGTGIGLAICRKIVQNHFGEIHASSSENEGAVFTVVLPEKQTS